MINLQHILLLLILLYIFDIDPFQSFSSKIIKPSKSSFNNPLDIQFPHQMSQILVNYNLNSLKYRWNPVIIHI